MIFGFYCYFLYFQIWMSALVTPAWTVELAPTKCMGSRAAVQRDSVEHGVKQVNVLIDAWNPFEKLHALHLTMLMHVNVHSRLALELQKWFILYYGTCMRKLW